jgi:DNA-binding IclR family transcriptional regulator
MDKYMPGSEPIQSVVRAGEIVRLVAESSDGLSVSDIAARLGLKTPTTHHLLRSLTHTGLLEKATAPIRYRIGPVIRDVASRQSSMGLHQAAMEAMKPIAAAFPQANVVLSEYINNDIAVTLRMSPDQPGVIQHPSHMSLSAYSSASTLLFQALWPASTRQNYRDRYPFEEYGGQWVSVAALDEHLAQVAQTGYALRMPADETRLAVASPVVSGDGRLLASIGASIVAQPASKVTASTRKRLIAAVRDAARQINQSIA